MARAIVVGTESTSTTESRDCRTARWRNWRKAPLPVEQQCCEWYKLKRRRYLGCVFKKIAKVLIRIIFK